MVRKSRLDIPLFLIVIALCIIGLLMVYSTSKIISKENYGDSLFFFRKQLFWFLASLLTFLIITFFPVPFYKNSLFIFSVFIVAIISLVAVFFFPAINNSHRWIKLFIFSIQPSEFAKIAAVLYLSYFLVHPQIDINKFKHLLFIMAPIMLMALLIIKEPDFGNFVLLLTISSIMIFLAGFKIKYILVALLVASLLFFAFLLQDKERISRLHSFFHPDQYQRTTGFQAYQSLCAVGSGGLFGVGPGNSVQKLFYLPYAYADFIFAILAEENGFFGSLLVIALFLFFFLRAQKIARRFSDRQSFLLVTGLNLLIILQAFTNIAVTLVIFPTKGIPLPFISSGGSSLMAGLICSGIILNAFFLSKTEFNND